MAVAPNFRHLARRLLYVHSAIHSSLHWRGEGALGRMGGGHKIESGLEENKARPLAEKGGLGGREKLCPESAFRAPPKWVGNVRKCDGTACPGADQRRSKF